MNVVAILGLSVSVLGGFATPLEFSGLVDIGHGRKILMKSRGTGSPTVVLISGARGSYDDWTTVLVSGKVKSSESAVFPQIAKFTRVIAYDRPGTMQNDGSLTSTTPVKQPTSAVDGVADLHALLKAAKVPGPYVLVAHSLGGGIAQLYARRYPNDVAGLVLVDPFSQFLSTTLTPAQWSTFVNGAKQIGNPVELEAADHEASAAALLAAPAVRAIPVVVISSDRPFEFGVGGAETWAAWGKAHALLAKALHAKHITKTNSSHGIQLEQPKLVVDAIREVVDKVRQR